MAAVKTIRERSDGTEMVQFSIYCEKDVVHGLDKIAQKLGLSRNEAIVFFLKSALGTVGKMDSSGILKFLLRSFGKKRKTLDVDILNEPA